MEAFEDENPFESEPERLHSGSSSSGLDFAGTPSSPTIDVQPARTLSPTSPTSPTKRNTFPSSGSHRQPQTFKNDYCCARDHWLHSGEDVEVLVRLGHLGRCNWIVVSSDTSLVVWCVHRLQML